MTTVLKQCLIYSWIETSCSLAQRIVLPLFPSVGTCGQSRSPARTVFIRDEQHIKTMLKSVLNRNSLLACSADCPADNHARQLAQFLYETLQQHIKTMLNLSRIETPCSLAQRIVLRTITLASSHSFYTRRCPQSLKIREREKL
jgi:hypothetical protein